MLFPALFLACVFPLVPRAQGSWTKLAEPPIAPRQGAFALASAERAIVFGGSEGAAPPGDVRQDGAVFDVRTRAWRVLPACPLGRRTGATVAGEGRDLLYVAGLLAGTPPACMGARLDLESERWTVLPDWPVRPRVFPVPAFDGRRVALFGGHLLRSVGPAGEERLEMEMLLDGALVDLDGNTVAVLPKAPIEPRIHATVALLGDGLLVCGGYGTTKDGLVVPRDDAAFLDLKSRSWTRLVETRLLAGDDGFARRCGDDLLLFNRKGFGGWEANAALFHPSSRTFTAVAGLEKVPFGVTQTATHVFDATCLVFSARQDAQGYEHGAWTWNAKEALWRELDLGATRVAPRMDAGFAATGRYAALFGGSRAVDAVIVPQGGASDPLAPGAASGGSARIPHFGDGLLFDLERRTARAIPAGPLAPRADPALVWVGGKLLVAFGHEAQIGRDTLFADAALFDPRE